MIRDLTVLLLIAVVGWCGSYTTEENHDPGGDCPLGCSCSSVENRTMVSCYEVSVEKITNIFGNLPHTAFSLEIFNMTTTVKWNVSNVKFLQDLSLINSGIQDLRPINISNFAPYLVRLNLSYNLISSLQNYSFESIANLQVLNLSHNGIASIERGCFNGLSLLQELDLTFNKITTVVKDAFQMLSSLRSLKLGGNQLLSFCASAVGLSRSLEVLDLSFNRFTDISNETFSGLDSLQVLDLKANKLSVMRNDSVIGLSRLMQLDVSHNLISNIQDNTFINLDALLRLNLSNNELQALGDRSFSGLGRLQQLDVSYNRISRIAPGTFQDLGGLVELSLADNPSPGLMVLVGTGRRLQAVDASRAGLTQIPAALTRSIRTLTLSGNAVTAVRCGDVDSYPLLQVLDLSDNSITELEEDALGRLEVLSTLFLAGNKLTAVPRSLPAGLRILHLQRNPIQTLNVGDLQGLPKLRELSLKCCEISLIQNGALSQVTSLESLDLSENPMKNLSGNALSGPSLSVLRLSRLSEVSADAAGIREMSFPVTSPERLEVLSLDYSPVLARQLLADTAALAAFRRLRELDLRHAGITRIRSDLFHFLPRLITLRLGGNPLDCDTDLTWLADWVRRHRSPNLQDAICATPSDFLSMPLVNLSIFSEEPPESTTARYDATITVPLTAELISTTEAFSDSSTANRETSELYTEYTHVNNSFFAITFHITDDQSTAQYQSSSTDFYDSSPTVNQDSSTPFTNKYEQASESDHSKFTGTISSTDAFSGVATTTTPSIITHSILQQLHSNSSTNAKTSKKAKQTKVKNKNITQHKAYAQGSTNITINTLHQSDAHSMKYTNTGRNGTQRQKQKLNISESGFRISEVQRSKYSNSAGHKSIITPLTSRNMTNTSQAYVQLEPTAASEVNNVTMTKFPLQTLIQNYSRSQKPFHKEHQLPKGEKSFNIMQGDESTKHDDTHGAAIVNQSAELALFSIKAAHQSSNTKHSNNTLRAKLRATKHVNSPRNTSVVESSKKSVELKIANVTKSSMNYLLTFRNNSINETVTRSVFVHKLRNDTVESRQTESKSTTATSQLEGENLVLENVTLSVGDRSVFHNSRASDAFASGVRVMVKDSGVPVSGSHPGMFVLLGLGLAMAGALAMALSHCAKRRRRQAVEYSRQQDIEVRSMSSIGDLW